MEGKAGAGGGEWLNYYVNEDGIHVDMDGYEDENEDTSWFLEKNLSMLVNVFGDAPVHVDMRDR